MRRRWLGLCFVLSGATFCAGYLCHWYGLTPRRLLREISRQQQSRFPDYTQWARRSGRTGLEKDHVTDLERLATFGYLSGYERRKAGSGVLVHHREQASPGYNLYTSGNGPEVVLVDMDGEELHTWRYPLPEEVEKESGPLGLPYFRRCHLYPNGDLVGIVVRGNHLDTFVVKLSRDSEILWRLDLESHHDLEVQADGQIYVLTRAEKAGREPILEDSITVLDPDGAVRERISILEAFLNSRFANAVERTTTRADPLHTNALHVLDGSLAYRSPAFRAGNILLSFRELHSIGVMDPEEREIVWLLSGMWKMQHDPELIPGGRMLIFDNFGNGGTSRVIEFDPFSQQVFWSYGGSEQRPLFSRVRGGVQRLENGNTLITETTAGRVIEVTRDHNVVWEFVNPHQAGDKGELIAAIPTLVRMPVDTIRNLLPATPRE